MTPKKKYDLITDLIKQSKFILTKEYHNEVYSYEYYSVEAKDKAGHFYEVEVSHMFGEFCSVELWISYPPNDWIDYISIGDIFNYFSKKAREQILYHLNLFT